jgi:guanylate kinase
MASELRKLQEYREQIVEENQKYVDGHPELAGLLDEFVTAVMTHKPTDLVKFGYFYFSNLRKNGVVGPSPIVIAGPSGVGKGTLINKLLNKFPNLFGFCASHTTRQPRPGEVNGVHYIFVSEEEFEDAVERGDFVEYAKVHTNYYGTSHQAIDKVRMQD